MTIRPDPRQLQALARLSVSADGEVLRQMLHTELSKAKDLLIEVHGDSVSKYQGAARALREVLALLEEAPALAAKSR